MLVANDTKPDAVYVCPCLICIEKGSLEPKLPLVATMLRTPSYAEPWRIEKLLNAQWTDGYSKQTAALLETPSSAFSYDLSGIFVDESEVYNAI